MSEPLLRVEGLQLVRSRRFELQVDELSVAAGEVLAIIGPNGAGKSSLLQALNLLVPATFRMYRFSGRAVDRERDALFLRREMAYVFQEALLLDGSVLENAASGLRLRGMPKAEAFRRASHWLDRLEVGHLSRQHARHLSGGEAQRVSLARALALEPKLVLLDEPFGALDVLTRSTLLRELRPMLREAGATALLVTHDVTEVARLADRVAVMEAGRVVQVGSPGEVFADPKTRMVEQMLHMGRDVVTTLGELYRGDDGTGASGT
ncbi:MAG TPA: ATP-binding cassette domain-containing protein [Symbiobacteriaceae bacterium]|nr:ATP-binding cassette domain-containing protein [Symbiobacteriaceae bacterium]